MAAFFPMNAYTWPNQELAVLCQPTHFVVVVDV